MAVYLRRKALAMDKVEGTHDGEAAKAQEGLYAFGVLYRSPRFDEWEGSKDSAYGQYRIEWNSRVTARDPGSIPLNINVEVTTRCNLACTFCSHPALLKEQTGDLPIEYFEKALRESAQHGGIAAINLNGLGEPMLRRDLDEFIRVGRDYGAKDIMFHTNGTQLVSEEYIRKMIDAGLDRVIVSVDSPDKATYEAMRLIKGSWDTSANAYRPSVKGSPHELLVENTRRLIRVVEGADGPRPVVRVTCVLTDKTLPQMQQYRDFWISEGADVITYQDLTWHDKLIKEGTEHKAWETSEESAIQDEYASLKDLPEEVRRSFVCPPLYQSMWIEFDGQVVPCSHPDARQHMVMGMVQETSFPEIWSGAKYRELRELHESGRWVDHPICGRCEVPLIELRKRVTGQSVVDSAVSVEAF